MTRFLTRTTLIFALILTLAACGKSSGNTTADAVKSPDGVQVATLDALGKGQYGREYDLMLPAQRALIDRNLFITCGAKLGFGTITDIHVIETYDEPIDVPGVSTAPVPAKAVSLSMKADGQALTMTFHSVQAADGKWYWISSPDAITAFQAGQCPA